ncbi:metallophosphoesterase [Pseudomonas chlororaphis]|uniref:metallophosphoesterase n=2 Tax=Pseudomonas chlororaphis TaxID=587753 RepID=UPI001B30C992|nr:metallophosphoesterase [Pseudomonas chlororaphis]MBP5054355.1 metallophosphoesterase [Pseudomonas chlororaphis]MBP5137488.1 metallophosphoesterase [Pseudomonas chlororaphis]QTT99532.1 metallophosphoesterase [Pseudomonas chlororaphis]
MNKIQRFEINTAGRDFAVGDIHGHFTKLQAALDAVQFDPTVDRLFSVGDLVDRGPESADVDTWLAKPWFHAVRGNHEQMAIEAYRFDPSGRIGDVHLSNGGAWIYGRSSVEQACYVELLADLPLIIEVMTPQGPVGIVHADCPFPTWQMLQSWAEGNMPGLRNVEEVVQWSRSRIASENHKGVSGVQAVIVGHTPTRQPAVLGNVYHIDTGAWMGGHFTMINLATLQCHPPINPKLQWDWEPKP